MPARVRRTRGHRAALRTAVPVVTLLLAATACGGTSAQVGAVGSTSATGSPTGLPTARGTQSTAPSSAGRTPADPPAAARSQGSTLGDHQSTPRALPSARAAQCVNDYYSGMTTAQRVGQLFMGGVSAAHPDASQLRTLRDQHVGSVMLTGRSNAGTAATRKLVDGIRAQSDQVGGRRAGMVVATDQEGGQVQVLSGPGFSAMPDGLTQGGWSTATLRTRASDWAKQLKAAGVDLNLAPIADVVPASLGTRNRPIGYFHREYGHTPAAVTSHSGAFAAGFAQSGVMTTLKHFPGLGQVLGNTDTTANVVDSVTTAKSASLEPFRAGIQAGSPFVMISSAVYTKIDAKHLAAFSPAVIGQLLRHDLNFKGVVISDDLGDAVAVRSFTPAQRAVDFIAAGGDMVLTIRPSIVPEMTRAVQSRMKQDASFRDKVDASVHRILDAKHKAGLLDCG
ncbi:glycoside hydrolase family 3 N-terminal domain-containing protein [Streptomyces sp. NRRL S-340]|uniref:glycoside hydrolase family 3 N-terminal domain-containing protein n=1 Tax=Streptomyces sp. NRRL S-340 TaxID=1463901 RepID=UPI0005679BA1|nr:glycoside hydrolase family 3 N-terminal domain-containing protein [Streptomyces sp. NRRL S-340]